MYDFNYHRAASTAEAVKLLKSGGKILAGGQSLMPTMKQRLAQHDDLVDIRHIKGLDKISAAANKITIGAAAVHADVAKHKDVKKMIPALAKLAGGIGDIHVRNRGTLGGSIANNDPAACYPAACLALKAQIKTAKGKTIAADDFFDGLFSTALADDDMIVSVSFAKPQAAAYEKFRQPASRFALVGVFVARFSDGVRVAVTGAGDDGVFRHSGLEKALSAHYTVTACDGVDVSAADLMSDLHGSADYRAHLIKVLTKRAVG